MAGGWTTLCVAFFLQVPYLRYLSRDIRGVERSVKTGVKKKLCGSAGLSGQDDSMPIVPFLLMQGIILPALPRMTSSFIRVKLDPIAMQICKPGGELEGKLFSPGEAAHLGNKVS